MILTDILQVIYAPQRAFKKIIENPKYLGALIILILFVGLQIGYEYSQISKTEIEQTSSPISNLATYTNSTFWTTPSNVTLRNDFSDYFNYTIYQAGYGYYPALFGNSSLQMSATNANTLTSKLDITSALNSVNDTMPGVLTSLTVDCSAQTGFQDLALTLKQTSPSTAPQTATLIMYSASDSNFYILDLTSTLSNLTANGDWSNYTIPVGPEAAGWASNGNPSWGNITALTFSCSYPTGSNVSMQIGALFFRGQYQTLIQLNSTGFLLNFLQQFALQFLFTWFLLTGLIYLFFKGLKADITWKPLFIAIAMALFVLLIRALINLIATVTLPTIYYTFDAWPGLSLTPYGTIFYPAGYDSTLFAASQAALATTNAAVQVFASITVVIFFVSYVWIAALAAVVIGTLKPDFSPIKRIGIAAISVGVTVLLLLLLGVGA